MIGDRVHRFVEAGTMREVGIHEAKTHSSEILREVEAGTRLLDTRVWLWMLAAPERCLPDRIRASAVVPIPIEQVHALASGRFPRHHRDSFDRVLVAQARHLDVPIVTTTRVYHHTDVPPHAYGGILGRGRRTPDPDRP